MPANHDTCKQPSACNYILRSNLMNALTLAIQVQRETDARNFGASGKSGFLAGLEQVQTELQAGQPLRMLHDNLLCAMTLAVRSQSELDACRFGPTGKSAFLQGLESNLAALEAGQSLAVR